MKPFISIKGLVFILTSLLPVSSCSRSSSASGNGDNWQNPVISCQLKPQEDPIRQYPTGTSAPADGMQDFCRRMQDRFSHSGLSPTEAAGVYEILLKNRIINDASYGMPGPGAGPSKSLDLTAYEQRIAIRKMAENSYELFYSYTNCGTNYEHIKITLEGEKVKTQERIEAWSGSFPC